MSITEQQSNRLRTLVEDIEVAALRKQEAERKYGSAMADFLEYLRQLRTPKEPAS
jgi:hypothetical protein